jgi:aminoglycoside 3-N-acetyltransferase I
MPDAIQIVRLMPPDLGLMRALNRMFAEAFEDAPTYDVAPPDDAYLTRTLAKDHIIVLAALAEGTVVGGLVAYELDKLEQARSELYIYDLAVAEAHRRRGVATAVIGRLQEMARDRGAWVIFVQGDYGDDPALALYRKLGVQEEVLHFDLPPSGA